MMKQDEQLRAQHNKLGTSVKYGTAGFRDHANKINYIAYRVGIFVTILSQTTKYCWGIVISASHNPKEDNGIKINDPWGHMMPKKYQSILEQFVDQSNLEKAILQFKQFISKQGQKWQLKQTYIFIGGDTRSSTTNLLKLLTDGIQFHKEGNCINFGFTTTPQLQFYVYLCNHVLKTNLKTINIESIREQYWNRAVINFQKIANYMNWNTTNNNNKIQYRTIDCANGVGEIIDGDKQGTIITQFFKILSKQLYQKTKFINENQLIHININSQPLIGFVQTFYANYSSSFYLKNTYSMQPIYAATGVKNVHQKAQKYDIGIYFQGNGHGTILFNQKFIQKLQSLINNKQMLLNSQLFIKQIQLKNIVSKYIQFIQFFYNIYQLIHPSLGDAIINFLFLEIVLFYFNKNYTSLISIYHDLKSKTSKIYVKYKQKLKVTDIQDQVIEPIGLQKEIQEILIKYKGKKAFLRASGTENVLRLHVQAETQQQVEEITKEITQLVKVNKYLN